VSIAIKAITVTSGQDSVELCPPVILGLRREASARSDPNVSRQPIELLFLHPLPFGGEVWSTLTPELQPLISHAPTTYALGRSLEQVAAAVLDMVEGQRLVVIGNSIGGSCALEVAAAAPDRVEHLVLIGAKAGHRPEPDYRDWALDLLSSDGVAAVWDQVWEPLFSPTTSPSIVERAKVEALSMPPDLLAAGIAQFHGRRDLTSVLDEWSKPLTVVTGRQDRTPGREVSDEMARRARRGSLRVVANSGHYVPIEQPTVLASILRDVVASTA